MGAGERTAGEPVQPGGGELGAQGVGEVLAQALDGEAGGGVGLAGVEQPHERVGRALPRIGEGALLHHVAGGLDGEGVGGVVARLVGPDVVGDPAGAPRGVGLVVAEHFDGELGVELGDGLAELAQVAPGAALEVGEGAAGDVAGAVGLGALGVEAPGEDAEHLRVVALLGELVDALEAAPEAEAEVGLAGELEEGGAGGARCCARRGRRGGRRGRSGRGGGRPSGRGSAARPRGRRCGGPRRRGGPGTGASSDMSPSKVRAPWGRVVGLLVGLLEEGQDGLREVGRLGP